MQKFYPSEELNGNRLVLRKHDVSLAACMFNYVEQDRERLRRYLPWVDLTRTVQDEINYIEMTNEAWRNFTLFDYGLFRKSDDVYMGNCGVHTIQWGENRCEIGYWILGKFEGQGYMSEAVQTVETEMFRLGFQRIEIRCNSRNVRSASVPRRNGYHLEKVIRKDEAIEECRDTLVFTKSHDLPFEDAADFLVSASAEHVILFTDDVKATREFVAKGFGVAPVLDQPEICEFKIGHQSLVLQPPDAARPKGTATEMAYWPVKDLTATIQKFISLGGTLDRGPIDVGDGEHICQIRDPLGNLFGLRGK